MDGKASPTTSHLLEKYHQTSRQVAPEQMQSQLARAHWIAKLANYPT
jgi:DNA-binding protein H-NS